MLKYLKLVIIYVINRYKYRKNKTFFKYNSRINGCFFYGHNSIGSNSNVCGSSIDVGTYVGENCVLNKVKIGKFCSIANGIKVLKNNHPLRYFSTHPAFHRGDSELIKKIGLAYSVDRDVKEFSFVEGGYQVVVGSDVWIGEDVKILSGITIGDGAVIAAGSVVTKDIKPYAVVGGVPSKLIKYRFDESEIDCLLKLRIWDKELDEIRAASKFFKNNKKLIEYCNENH